MTAVRILILAWSFLIFSLGLAHATISATEKPDFPALTEFKNENGNVLDVTIVAEPRYVKIGNETVISDVFTICLSSEYESVHKCDSTPSMASNPYAGGLLIVKPGDHLKITLVNKLREGNGLKGTDLLTNLHTHGLLVRARGSSPDDVISDDIGKFEKGSIGDFIFTAVQPEGMPMAMGHAAHASNGMTTLRYDIEVPSDHPTGLFWIHPHVHGAAKKQVSSGMAALIQVGDLAGPCLNISKDKDGTLICVDSENDPEKLPISRRDDIKIRTIILKDAQLVRTANDPSHFMMNADQMPSFCDKSRFANNAKQHYPFCEGYTGEKKENLKFENGKWVFTINGAEHPEWNAPIVQQTQGKPGNAEVWRIQNGSANVTYNLCLEAKGFLVKDLNIDDYAQERCDNALPFQVLSFDGTAFGTTGIDTAFVPADILQRRVVLMPGSRIEILVTPRDPASCKSTSGTAVTVKDCPQISSTNATEDFPVALRNLSYSSGGDAWPEVELAKVTFKSAPAVQVAALEAKSLNIDRIFSNYSSIQNTKYQGFVRQKAGSDLCREGGAYILGEGEYRRIYFGIVTDKTPGLSHPEQFLLGQTVVDKYDNEWFFDESGARIAVSADNLPELIPLDPNETRASLCILQTASLTEKWQLVNISSEVHNFHIHQNKFTIATCNSNACMGAAGDKGTTPSYFAPSEIDKVNLSNAILVADAGAGNGGDTVRVHDTTIVPRGDEAKCKAADIISKGDGSFILQAQDFSVDAPRYLYKKTSGCIASKADKTGSAGWIEVNIPFNKPYNIGKYVFHCHILEHEDLGMMATIRVLTTDQVEQVEQPPGIKLLQ